MSRATQHLEKLLKALQFDSMSILGKYSTQEEVIPPPFNSTQVIVEGSNDPLENKTSMSSQISTLSSSETNESSIPSHNNGNNGTKDYGKETTQLVQQLGNSRVQVATLEAQMDFLAQKVKEQEMVDSLYIQRLEEEVVHLKDIVEKEMIELSKRQTQVEQDVPSLEDQLKTIKDLLYDFDISKKLYMELKSIPKKLQTTREHILILVYEKYQRDQKEIQELQISRDNSREGLARANDEVQRLTCKLQRIEANHANDRREAKLDFNCHSSRIQRLEAELRDSLVQIEVLRAKGALFDELQGKLNALEAKNIDIENQNAIMATTLQVSIQEKENMRESLKEKEHTLDLLSMDKIYLSKEVHCQAEQLRKLEAQLEQQHQKLQEINCARQELYNKVLSNSKDSQVAYEQCLQVQISHIQEKTNQDIEKICKEANSNANEKIQTIHKLKDETMAIAEMYHVELQDSKRAYNELFLKFQELQRVTNLKEVESCNNLKVANLELDQQKTIFEKTKIALHQSKLENETWIAKVKVLKDNINVDKSKTIEDLKNELEKQVNELKEELRVTQAQIEAHQKEENTKFETYVKRKDTQLKTCEGEKISKIEVFEGEKSGCISTMRAKALADNESKLRESLLENKFLEDKIRSITKEKDRMSFRLQLMQEDIRKLLCAQGSVEQLQSLLKEKGVFLDSRSRLKPINTPIDRTLIVKKGSIPSKIGNLE